MKKIYYLSSCSTCSRIMKELEISLHDFVLQDIKKEKITEEQLEEMKTLAGSYEKLFSRRSMKYKSLGLKNVELTEADYKKYILEEYTFLLRPTFIIDKNIYIGNSKKNVELVKDVLSNK